ncbi:MAG: phosphoenolpyruvate kinase [Myxococcaceae bacterium]|nr:MAG: phosphoenolpyruvate kinase [Myxococcaceae bacterium]
MKTTLTPERSAASREALRRANTAFARVYPGESSQRQPVHTVYGGAHLFRSNTARKMGDLALATLRDHAPDGAHLAHGLGLPQRGGFAQRVYARVVDKLEREPVEDFRLDFEDGYGHRPDAEEDAHAVSAAQEVARGLEQGTLPPFIGIRVKSFTEELYARSSRTLDLFVTSLLEHSGGRLPPSFVVTLPKVTVPEQVTALAHLLSELESVHNLPSGALMLELMVETPQALFDSRGRPHLLSLVEAGEGRCSHVHLGAYDYTAALNLERAYYQGWDLHPAQLPVRYAAVYAFFLEGLEPSSQRLKAFVDKAAQATMLGGVFDDAATGQGLLNFFLRGLACGALTEEEVRATGLTLEELHRRSFRAIVQARATPSR